jgi:hypothetical protein
MDDGTTQPWRQIITCSRERIARAPNENLETLPLATSACARQTAYWLLLGCFSISATCGCRHSVLANAIKLRAV